MNSYITTELVSQHNAQLIAEAAEYRLAKSVRRGARRAAAKGRGAERIPEHGKAKLA
jgi:hypothetical protein